MPRHPAILTSFVLAWALALLLSAAAPPSAGPDSDPAASSVGPESDPAYFSRSEEAGSDSGPTAASGWFSGLATRTRVVQICVVVLCLGLLILIKK